MKEMQIVTLLYLVLTAMLSDLHSGKIPNELIMAGLICGLCYQWVTYGVTGILLFLGGCFLPVLVLGILFYFRMIGAGDIKLFCMIGGYIGPEDCLECMILAVLLGGIIALILMIRRGNAGQRISYLGDYISCWTETREWKSYISGVNDQAKFCFSVPIFLSILSYIAEYFL